MRRTREDVEKTVQATQAAIKVHEAWDAGAENGFQTRDVIDILSEEEALLILEKNWYTHSVPFVAALMRLAGPDTSRELILELAMNMDIELWKRRNKASS